MIQKILSRIEELKDDYVKFLCDIAKIESPTSYKEGVDRVGAYVIEKAKARGWQIEIHREAVAGDAVCITMNPEAKGAPVCLSAHMDTVHPIGSIEKMPVHIKNGRLYGPGVYDCKGGIASSFLAMAALEDCGFRNAAMEAVIAAYRRTLELGKK